MEEFMRHRKYLFIIVVLLFGLMCRYYLRPRINVIVCEPASSLWDLDNLQKKAKHDPIVSGYLDYIKKRNMKPLVQAGPFFLAMNPTNGDFQILHMDDQTTLIDQTTEGNEISLELTAEGGRVNLICTYEKDTGRPSRSIITSNDKHGLLGLPLFSYVDSYGNGHFDRMIDHKTGNEYEEKDLHWVIKRNIFPDKGVSK